MHQPGQVTQAIFPFSMSHNNILMQVERTVSCIAPCVVSGDKLLLKIELVSAILVHHVALTCNTGDNICNNAFQLAPCITCKMSLTLTGL